MAMNMVNKKLPEDIAKSKEHHLRVRSKRVKHLSLVSLCGVTGVACTVLECFAIFNIEYCVGEDLVQLYWSLWSILQVGSNIAILGVILQFWIMLGDVETPSWAVALGTPVLVFAALAFLLKELWKKTSARIFSKDDKQHEDTNIVPTPKGSENDLENGLEPTKSQTTTIISICDPAQKRNSFWSRDLHHLISSIITENPTQRRTRQSHVFE